MALGNHVVEDPPEARIALRMLRFGFPCLLFSLRSNVGEKMLIHLWIPVPDLVRRQSQEVDSKDLAGTPGQVATVAILPDVAP